MANSKGTKKEDLGAEFFHFDKTVASHKDRKHQQHSGDDSHTSLISNAIPEVYVQFAILVCKIVVECIP